MQDLLGIGTNRRESMIGTGIGLGLAGYRLRTSFEAMPSLDLQFADRRMIQAVLGPTPSFSRASTGTYFDSQGVLKSAAVNGPRFNHTYNGTSWVSRGLLVEEQRTNQVPYSEEFQLYVSNGSITQNTTISPNGTTTADTYTVGSTTAEYRCIFNYTTSAQSVFSCYAKSGTHNFIQFRTNAGNGYVNFNLSDGTFSASTATGSVTSVGNGWYRCSAVFPAATVFSFSLQIVSSLSSARAETFAGNGTQSVILWGSQIESGSFPTSYIATNGSAATRSADVCQITGGDFSGFWNGTEGSVSIEYDTNIPVSVRNAERIIDANDGSDNERITFFLNPSNQGYVVTDGGVTQSSLPSSSAVLQSVATKTCAAFKLNDFAVSYDGASVSTDTSGTMPSPTKIDIGYVAHISNRVINGHIARLRYYPTRLTNAKLQELST